MHGVEARHADGGLMGLAAADNDIVAACRAGDRLALERLLTPHERPLYVVCLGILRNAEDAEDAVQEAFLRALRALPRFRGEAALRTWLQRIAVNVCLEWKRARKPVAPLDIAERTPSNAAPVATTAADYLTALDALGTLTPHQRAAVVLKDVQGLSVEEIAATMSCSAKKVENELYRGRKALAVWRARNLGAEA
ncbi:MAG: RNA polymerase sigma factor [Armatimonadetes bacterium]|nr:RNA polymerase sigma factor [Armatimonadota bacterium]